MIDKNTSLQLYEYIECQKKGTEYKGTLNEEAQATINRLGNDLRKLEAEAEAMYFFDHVLSS